MCDSDEEDNERETFRNSLSANGELKSTKNELVLLGDLNEFFSLARIT